MILKYYITLFARKNHLPFNFVLYYEDVTKANLMVDTQYLSLPCSLPHIVTIFVEGIQEQGIRRR
jgi:hypothetical protein